jgi:hypothetical protein
MKHVVLISAVALLFAPAAHAKKNPPPPDISSFAGGATPVRVASSDEALAAADVAGADTEVLPGLTTSEATGRTPTPLPTAASTSATEVEGGDAGASCWFTTIWGEWGIYPYQQRVNANTYWCARNGTLTYRSTNTTLGSSLCIHKDAYDFRVAGGVGTPYVIVQAGGSYSCGIPWIGGYNTDRWLRAAHTADGDAWLYDHS